MIAVSTSRLPPESLIVLEASDGLAVVVLGDPLAALELAERALSASLAGLPLSAGINHGAVQLMGNGNGARGMIGDGIAVAASVAEFASPSRLLISRSFREALAEAAPGREAALAGAGTFTDTGLRTHDLFRPDERAARGRGRRYAILSAAAALAVLGAGVAYRSSVEGRQQFVDGVIAKYRDTAAQGERTLRRWVEKVKF